MDTIDDDLIAYTIRNNVGLSTFVQLSAVCKRLHHICRSDESLLVSAALYTGGLTRTHFMGLFALSPHECKKFPHRIVNRVWYSGTYTMYGEDAVHLAVQSVGGVSGWSRRIAASATHCVSLQPQRPKPFRHFTERRQWKLEEDLHMSYTRKPTLPIGYTVPNTETVPHIRCKRPREVDAC